MVLLNKGDLMNLLVVFIKMQSLAYCSLNFSSVELQNRMFNDAKKAWDNASVDEREAALKVVNQ